MQASLPEPEKLHNSCKVVADGAKNKRSIKFGTSPFWKPRAGDTSGTSVIQVDMNGASLNNVKFIVFFFIWLREHSLQPGAHEGADGGCPQEQLLIVLHGFLTKSRSDRRIWHSKTNTIRIIKKSKKIASEYDFFSFWPSHWSIQLNCLGGKLLQKRELSIHLQTANGFLKPSLGPTRICINDVLKVSVCVVSRVSYVSLGYHTNMSQ